MTTVKRNQSVEKVLDIIEVMSVYGGPIRLNELSEKLGLSPTTVYRFLQTLMDKGYVRKDEENTRYFLTLKLKYYSDMIQSNYSLHKIASPFLEDLSKRTGESASLVVLEDEMAVYIDKHDGPNRMVRSFQKIGNRAPLYCTGVGKIFLADMEREERKKILENQSIERLTVNTITEINELEEEILQVQARGISYDNEECEIGARCVAAPIRDFSGKVIASVSVSGPTSRMTEDNIERIEASLREISGEISQVMGYIKS